MDRLVTLGYEGTSIGAFIETLEAAGIAVVVDVREAPTSRRREFAKRALQSALQDAGIEYRHNPRLGAPKPLRDQVKGDGDYQHFFDRYAEHLAANHEVVASLVTELDGNVALMCYERDYRICHRRLVADAVARRTGLTPQHLQAPRGRS